MIRTAGSVLIIRLRATSPFHLGPGVLTDMVRVTRVTPEEPALGDLFDADILGLTVGAPRGITLTAYALQTKSTQGAHRSRRLSTDGVNLITSSAIPSASFPTLDQLMFLERLAGWTTNFTPFPKNIAFYCPWPPDSGTPGSS